MVFLIICPNFVKLYRPFTRRKSGNNKQTNVITTKQKLHILAFIHARYSFMNYQISIDDLSSNFMINTLCWNAVTSCVKWRVATRTITWSHLSIPTRLFIDNIYSKTDTDFTEWVEKNMFLNKKVTLISSIPQSGLRILLAYEKGKRGKSGERSITHRVRSSV